MIAVWENKGWEKREYTHSYIGYKQGRALASRKGGIGGDTSPKYIKFVQLFGLTQEEFWVVISFLKKKFITCKKCNISYLKIFFCKLGVFYAFHI